jgi:Na+/proline symporter
MFQGWAIVSLAIGYVGVLFAVAWAGDRMSARQAASVAPLKGRPLRYALSLGVFCTSWTFFGSVGVAATSGFDFIPVYIGALLFFLLGWRVIRRIVRLSKAQNLTSIADFMAARYGKSQAVAAIVSIVAVVGSLPYIALQLKAVVAST